MTNPIDRQTELRSIASTAAEFLFDAKFSGSDADKDDLVEILRALEDCREEGRSIYPEIILTSNLEACVAPIFPVETVVCGEILERP